MPAPSQPELYRPRLTYPDLPYGAMLDRPAQLYPEREAIVFKDANLTFRELDGLVNAFANALRELGIGRGDRVCLFMTNRPEYVVAFFAIARLGAVSSPMNPSYKEREVAYQIGDSQAVAVVVQQDLLELVRAVRGEVPQLKHIIVVGPAAAGAADVVRFADLVARASTARPAPVAAGDELLVLPYSSGTTGLPKGVQGYGLTEAGPVTHLNPVHDERLLTLDTGGLPCNDTEQKIVDLETGERELPVGEVGEIIVRGPQIMLGYWNAPEATAAAIRNGWLYTGDIGRLDAHGYLTITDRKKEMIKYKGFGIAPAEIEALLFEHEGVADCAVIGKPDPEAGEVPKAFVVSRDKTLTAEALLQWARGRLAGYKTLQEIQFVDAIPKTASGKILRRVLKEEERKRLGLA